MNLSKYFTQFPNAVQRKHEALRLHYIDGLSIVDAAKKLNLSLSYLYAEKKNASNLLKAGIEPFFIERKTGPKTRYKADSIREEIISLRKRNYSILDIKASLDACGLKISHETINEVLKEEGFSRLPRRTYTEKNHLTLPEKLEAPRSSKLDFKEEEFSTGRSGGVLSFLPLIEKLGIVDAIKKAEFPETSSISSVEYVLSFLALKLIGNKRLSHDESWSLDRVLGLFAGLNVLPKNASLASYSYRVSQECNRKFLLELNRIFNQNIDTPCDFNLDFKSIPHWGDESVLEKNYSTMRGKAVKSVLALIVQNVTSEKLAYTNAEITHDVEKDCVLEFVDFWKESTGTCPNMLIFDSQCTIYENLSKLNGNGGDDKVKFLTLRRRHPTMLEHAKKIPLKAWNTIEVDAGKRKPRAVQVYDETIKLPKYEGSIRQLIIIDHSKEPVFMLTNDFESEPGVLIRKYGRRWIIEQEIAEQISFFHLNQLSSSIVVKVDFDLTMTLLAHNLYRYMAEQIDRHEKCTAGTIHRCFIDGRAAVKITNKDILVTLSKRSHSPLLFELPWMKKKIKLSWNGYKISFKIGTTS